MGKVTYTPDDAGLAQVARSSQVGDACLDLTERAAGFAESIAPRDTGEYAASFVATRARLVVPGRGVVAGARLENTAAHAQLVEDRNGDHVLARTAAWIENND